MKNERLEKMNEAIIEKMRVPLMAMSIMLMLSGCERNFKLGHSPQAVDYVNYFIDTTDVPVTSTNVLLTYLPDRDNDEQEDKGGWCLSRRGQQNLVLLGLKQWEKNYYFKNHAALAHELGHCLLNMDHDESLREDGCPVTLMHKGVLTVLTTECWETYHDEYYQMFTDRYLKQQKVKRQI